MSTIPLTYAEWGWAEHVAWIRGRLATRGVDEAALTSAFQALCYRGQLMLVGGGRDALDLFLDAARRRRPGRNRVLVPSYVCPSVVDVVRRLGLDAVPVRVGSDLNLLVEDVVNRLDERSLAVVVVHMYGAPAQMRRITAEARRSGAFAFDDAAHVIGVAGEDGPLGNGGDAGLLSFHQSKTLTAGSPHGGGLLLMQTDDLAAEVRATWQRLERAPSSLVQHVLFVVNHLLDRGRHDPGYLFGRAMGRFAPRPFTYRGPTRIAPVALKIIEVQLRRLETILAVRREVARLYAEMLAGHPRLSMPQYAPGRYLSRVMIRFSGRDPNRLREAMRKRGVRTRLGYPPWMSPEDARRSESEALSSSLIEVPSGSGMNAEQVRRVVAVLDQALESER